MTAKDPLLSICIPAYNGGRFIKETLDSILSQDFTDFEVIITDDGSTDDTAEIIAGINDGRIKYFLNEKNFGFPENWNRCIEKISGKYVKTVCQDDLLLPGCLGKQVKILEENGDISLVFGASDVIDGSGARIMERQLYKQDRRVSGREFAKKTLRDARNRYGEPALAMFRSSDISEKQLYDSSVGYCIDWDVSMKMSYKGNVYYCADKLAQFRISTDSVSAEMHRKQRRRIKSESMALFDKHNRLGGLGLGRLDRLRFSVMTSLLMAARSMIIRMKQR